MRVIGDIPHPDFKITLFAWNGKFIIKIEQGMYEQTYKVSEMDMISAEEVREWLDAAFLEEVRDIFKTMNSLTNRAFERLHPEG
jgi:cobalamin biosynthesis protein CbiD